MKGTRKKLKLIILILILVMIVIPPLYVALTYINIENNAIHGDNFFDHDLSELHGGESAKLFFDEYADLRTYKDMKFYYRDSGRKISIIYNSWTVFALDVYYDEDRFREIINTVLIDTGLPRDYLYNDESFYEYLVEKYAEYGFSCWEIMKNEPLYQNNVAGFFIDVEHHTIRYCFIYNEGNKSSTFLDIMVKQSIDLPWNRKDIENDWAFNYPNL